MTRRDDETIVAVTIDGIFRLLSEEHVAAMIIPQELEPADMQRISDKMLVNLQRVQGIDSEEQAITVEGRVKRVQAEYWEEFVKAYDKCNRII